MTPSRLPTWLGTAPLAGEWRGWSAGTWLLACLLAAATTVGSYLAVGVIVFVTQEPCMEPATRDGLRAGRLLTATCFAVASAPWLVAAAFARHRARVLAFGVAASGYALYAAIYAFTASADEWMSWGICF